MPSDAKLIVLVVEDDPDLRQLSRLALALEGYAVMPVEDGLEALRLTDEGIVPDAVVLDMALPRLGGRDVLQELIAHPATSRIPIIAATGTDSRDLGLRNFDCILRKPFTTTALIDAVDNCLREAKSAQEFRSDSVGHSTRSSC
jgi:DNA-binding response OmpR family regulator